MRIMVNEVLGTISEQQCAQNTSVLVIVAVDGVILLVLLLLLLLLPVALQLPAVLIVGAIVEELARV